MDIFFRRIFENILNRGYEITFFGDKWKFWGKYLRLHLVREGSDRL
jgi:hypothetical protein